MKTIKNITMPFITLPFIILPFSIPIKGIKNPNCYTFEFVLSKEITDNFPKLTKNEKEFVKDVKDYEESLKKECAYMGLSDDKVKELIWITIKELKKDGIATAKEVKMFLKACPEYLEFI